MTNLNILAQIIVAFSVAFVWIFRFENINIEFKKFGLSDLTKSFVGALKISLATLMIVSIWYSSLTAVSSALMGLIMIVAQYFHFKAASPFNKRLPSLLLLILCLFIATSSLDII